METDGENLEVPYWRTLYEAAVLELDWNKQLEFIRGAEHAIMDRIEALNRSEGSGSEALVDALDALRTLRKIADRMAHDSP